ncbi:hypothetical protein RS84_01780 [Microbacterium hydrocarbonoxydans]|uniref:Uncharacterized protein n=1 Tax=Microbacterium hydrocarbonoxydans TaxID=273678 RepID=A0A0M2HN76_9MICO|nr:hypothetical protein RS84_01780 [Microbacterium hydrocarbonoxydans]
MDAVNQRIFRDWLRTHPADAARYVAAKREAARTDNARKTADIQEIRRPVARGARARIGAGL